MAVEVRTGIKDTALLIFNLGVSLGVEDQRHWRPIHSPRLGSITHNARGCMGPVLVETDVNQKNPLHQPRFEPRNIQSVPSRNINYAAVAPKL